MQAKTLITAVSLIALLAGCGDDAKPAAPEKPGFVVCDEGDIQAHDMAGISIEEGLDICNAIKLAKGGSDPTDYLYKALAKTVYVMKIKGSKDAAKDTAYQMMNIVEARGQIDDEKAAENTFEVVFKMYNGWNGHITPRDVDVFLRSAGDSGKNLSDDGLVNMMALVMEQKKVSGR